MALRGLLTDLHIHTKMSDGHVPLLEIIDIFGKGGVDVLNVADHIYDTITVHGKEVHKGGYCIEDWERYSKQVLKAQRYARKTYGMLVIQGAEITRADSGDNTPGFHIVAVDLKEPVDPNLQPGDIIRAIQAQGGITISAHPYDKGPGSDQDDRGNVFHLWENLETFRNIVDLWEIANGRVLYEIKTDGRQGYLFAKSNKTSSGLFYPISFSPKKFPYNKENHPNNN